MNSTLIYLILVLSQLSVLIVAVDEDQYNDENKSFDNNNENILKEAKDKREEVVPNYGILDNTDDLYSDEVTLVDTNDDEMKRSKVYPMKSGSETMKTCMLYVNQLLNLICDTDNWMASSHYRNSEKRKIKMRCCLRPCSMSSLKMHCNRRTESNVKHHLGPFAMLLRPEIAERLPTLPNDNNEIEKAKYSYTPNGFFGAFHP